MRDSDASCPGRRVIWPWLPRAHVQPELVRVHFHRLSFKYYLKIICVTNISQLAFLPRCNRGGEGCRCQRRRRGVLKLAAFADPRFPARFPVCRRPARSIARDGPPSKGWPGPGNIIPLPRRGRSNLPFDTRRPVLRGNFPTSCLIRQLSLKTASNWAFFATLLAARIAPAVAEWRARSAGQSGRVLVT